MFKFFIEFRILWNLDPDPHYFEKMHDPDPQTNADPQPAKQADNIIILTLI